MKRDAHDDFVLLSQLVDGRLSAEAFEALEERLSTDAEFRRRYVHFVDSDFELAERLSAEIPLPDIAPESAPFVDLTSLPRPRVPRRKTTPSPSGAGIGTVLFKLAAVLVIGIGAWWAVSEFRSQQAGSVLVSTPPQDSPGGNEPLRPPQPVADSPVPVSPSPEMSSSPEPGPPLAPASAPDSIAVARTPERDAAAEMSLEKPAIPNPAVPVVVGSVREVGNYSDTWEPGVDITIGEHFLEEGIMEFRLDTGVRVKIEGPARFEALANDHLRILTGRLSAEVPPTAVGFRVDANAVTVVDLGTRFAVTANAKGDAAVHVYDGEVTTQAEPGNETTPLHLKTGDTVRLDLETGQLNPATFDATLFAAKPAWTGAIDEHSRSVKVLDRPPRDAMANSFPQGEVIAFKERTARTLYRDLAVNLDRPATTDGSPPKNKRGVVPKGRKISSYLVHRKGVEEEGGPIVATLHFDSPVLGIILDEELLHETDRSLGSTRTDYPSERAVRDPVGMTITLGEDRRTIECEFRRGHFDQIRVILAED